MLQKYIATAIFILLSTCITEPTMAIAGELDTGCEGFCIRSLPPSSSIELKKGAALFNQLPQEKRAALMIQGTLLYASMNPSERAASNRNIEQLRREFLQLSQNEQKSAIERVSQAVQHVNPLNINRGTIYPPSVRTLDELYAALHKLTR